MPLTFRQWRLAKEISQEKMAEDLGIHVNTYINWEKAPEKISVKDATRICRLLGVSMNDVSFLSANLQNVE